MNLRYRDLKKALDSLPEEQLDQNVSVYVSSEDEYFPLKELDLAEDDVLDEGHLILVTA